MTNRPLSLFVSYSYDSPAHSKRVLALAQALRRDGIDVELDQFHNEEIVDWPRWCNEQSSRDKADFVLCVCTAEYFRRIEGNVPPQRGKGVYWEGSLLDDEIYNDKRNRRILPVLFDDEPETSIPRFLRGWTYCRLRRFALDDAEYEKMLRILTGQASVVKLPLGEVPTLPPKSTTALSVQPVLSAHKIRWTDELRIYGEEALFAGRVAELALLDKALADRNVRVLSLWAEGGAGKTRLLVKWLTSVRDDGWREQTSVFVHSFYSQGSSDQRSASSDNFFEQALDHFGYTGPVIKDPSEKGRRLAELVAAVGGLLVLDGLEPLQYPPHDARRGELKDTAIRTLLLTLTNAPAGLCLITTRQELPELKARLGTAVAQQPLDRLSAEDGVALLRELQINGPDRELREAVEAYHGHAYSLMLLGTYLHDATQDHDIRRRHDFPLLDEDEDHDHHAKHIFEMYEKHFGPDSTEIAVLRLLGFFDRPAARELIDVLRAPEGLVYEDQVKRKMGKDVAETSEKPPQPRPVADALPDITRPLLNLSDADWHRVLTRLTDLRLLSVAADASLDSHALLREHFANQLHTQFPDPFRAGHRRLYNHLTGTTEYQPDTLPALQPLYQAVRHGCLAEMQQNACDDVYRDRILRGKEVYSTFILGAIGADLGAVACFFDQPWTRLSPNLSDPAQAWLLGEAAFRLRALGRLTDALEPIRAGLEMHVDQEDWKNAARVANNLSELELTLGLVADAVADGDQTVTFADRSRDAFLRMAMRTAHADALHQAGQRAEALEHFRAAEAIQAERQPEYPRLFSLGGFRYCDLLLAKAEQMAASPQATVAKSDKDRLKPILITVAERAHEAIKIAQRENWLLDIALDQLTLVRIALYRAILFHSPLAACQTPLDQAVNGLRASGNMDDLPRGLLTRAWAQFVGQDEPACRADLDEAWEIAERGSMKLFMADIHLYRARFFRDRAALEAAAALIKETGYHRRDEQLADLKEAAKTWPPD